MAPKKHNSDADNTNSSDSKSQFNVEEVFETIREEEKRVIERLKQERKRSSRKPRRN